MVFGHLQLYEIIKFSLMYRQLCKHIDAEKNQPNFTRKIVHTPYYFTKMLNKNSQVTNLFVLRLILLLFLRLNTIDE